MLVELTHEEEKAVRYTDRARAKGAEAESDPALGALRCNSVIEATDGRRYHAANIQLETEGLLAYDKPGPVLRAREGAGTFPNFGQIIPSEDPSMTIILNARFLRDALQGLEDFVTLRLYGETRPIEIMGHAKVRRWEAAPETYALIMPLSPKAGAATWRPHRGEGK